MDANLERQLNRALFQRCEVYHIVEKEATGKFGIPQNTKDTHEYPKEPDMVDVYCYFGSQVDNLPETRDSEPNRPLEESYNAYFKPNEDIRLNDKVVFKGETYILKKPRIIDAPKLGIVTDMILKVQATRRDDV